MKKNLSDIFLSSKPEALLFDMDGVLVDVSKSFRKAIIETSKSFGVKIEEDEIKALKKEGNANNDWILTHRLLKAHFKNIELEKVIKEFQKIYIGTDKIKGLREEETLIPSINFFSSLKPKYKTAIVTGRPRKDLIWSLKKFNIGNFFDCFVCMHDAKEKPSKDPVLLALKNLKAKTAIMFGDTVDDIISAKEANIIPIGVIAPGDLKEETTKNLLDKGAKIVLNKIDEIEDYL